MNAVATAKLDSIARKAVTAAADMGLIDPLERCRPQAGWVGVESQHQLGLSRRDPLGQPIAEVRDARPRGRGCAVDGRHGHGIPLATAASGVDTSAS